MITEKQRTEMIAASEGLADGALSGKIRASFVLTISPANKIEYESTGWASHVELIGALELVVCKIRMEIMRGG